MKVGVKLREPGPGLAARAPKFVVVGILATATHFLVLSCLVTIAKFPWPTVASAIGAVAGIVTSYCGNYAWTFARHEPHRNFVARFVAAYVFTMSVNTLMMYLQIDYLQLHYAAAFVVATSVSTAMNFLLSKFAVFERKGLAPSSRRVVGYD
jgi:putative flippase GtrA